VGKRIGIKLERIEGNFQGNIVLGQKEKKKEKKEERRKKKKREEKIVP